MPPFPGLVGASLKSRSPIADCEELWNWYVENVESQAAKSSPVLYPCPGFVPLTTFGNTPIRGLWAQEGRTFAVVADQLYEFFSDGHNKVRPPTSVPQPGQPSITLSTPIAPLVQMSTPVIYVNGPQGATTYGYQVTATNILGETNASIQGFTTVGPAQLSLSDNILVTWNIQQGATGYKVYRTTGGTAPPRLIATIANVSQTAFVDTGDVGDAGTPPTTNTTGSPTPNTTWGYTIVAKNFTGTTLPSPEGQIVGYPVLSANAINTITWAPVPSSTGYDIYRTTAPAITSTDPTLASTTQNQLVLIGSTVGSAQTTITDSGFLPGINDAAPPPLPTADTTLLVGGLPGSPALVSISSSGDAGREMFICAGGHGFVFDLDTSALTAVVDSVAQGGFIDGYFVGLDTDSSTLRMSNYLDGLTWDPTQIAQRNIAGDKWQSMIVMHREIWLFGEQTSEVWTNVGTAPFPFAPNTNVFIEVGSGALWTAVRVGGQLIWLGQGIDGMGVVYQANGYTPERVSNHALETAIQSYTYTTDAEAFGYQQEGHVFYVLTFPKQNATWVYDLTTQLWSQRGTWNALKNRYDCYRPNTHCWSPMKNAHLIGDRLGNSDGKTSTVFAMSVDFGHELTGGVIRRMRRAPHMWNDLASVAYRRLQVDLEVGLARGSESSPGVPLDKLLTTDGNLSGTDPTIMLRWSDDGGKTWSHEHWTTAGKLGHYRKRARWSRLGAARDRVFELVCSDPVPWRVISASLGVEPAVF
jgi:hypothetical protein